MYGGSKESGQIVGKVESTTAEVSFDEVAENTGCQESLQCADADGNEMTLSASLDSASGALIWRVEQSEEEVRRRVLSTNQMTSMLHDKERNRVYEKAITKIIANFVEKMDRRPTVLDVGAGTGLLSMMAARAGAEGVVGCEMYEPMAAVAEHVVADNGMSEEVQIIPAKSTDIDGFKVDLLVSELLDSALLGESCVFSHADAIGRLITEESENLNIPVSDRVIPHSATIYGKLVESVEVEKMVSVREFNLGIDSNGNKIGTPWRDDKEASRCQGGWPLIPVHWPAVKQRSGGEEVSEGTELLRFNFTRSDADDTPQSYMSELEVTLPAGRKDGEGVVSGLLLFWRLDLLSPSVDPERELFYTTDPGLATHWQDHWVQCIFPLARPITGLKSGDKIKVVATHNNLHLWFDVKAEDEAEDEHEHRQRSDNDSNSNRKKIRRSKCCVEAIEATADRRSPVLCTCGWHALLPTDRLLMLNDSRRQDWFSREMEIALDRVMQRVHEKGVEGSNAARFVLDLGDSSVLALKAAMYLQNRSSELGGGAVKVVSREAKLVSRMLLGSLGAVNGLDNFHTWDGLDFAETLGYFDEDEDEDEVEKAGEEGPGADSQERKIEILALVGDQYQFQLSARPTWQALSFLYQRTAIAPFLAEGAPIVPGGARVMAACFELTDLHVSHGINGTVSGFDHSHLDQQQRGWQKHQLPYKLADYKKRLLCTPVTLQTVSYSHPARSLAEVSRTVPIAAAGRLDCLAIWVDYLPGTCAGTGDGDGDGDRGVFPSYSPDNYPRQAGLGADFPPWYKANLLFASDEERRQVTPGADFVHISSSFEVGESDFAFSFELRGQ